MRYDSGETQDLVYRGKMMLVGIGVAYLTLWVLTFFTYPTLLVPGFLVDRSLVTLEQLAGMLAQFGFLSLFWLLVWAGIGWARYVLGIFLLVTGLAEVILSMLLDSGGAAPLVLGTMSLVSAAGLILSLGVERYIADRRKRGFPVLELSLIVVGLVALVAGTIGGELAEAWMRLQAVSREEAFASDVVRKLLPNLDAGALVPVASAKFREAMTASDVTDQFADVKAALGAFRDWPGLPAPGWELALQPEKDGRAFSTVAHYEKGDLAVSLHLDTSTEPWQVDDVYVEKLRGK
jgi:hypothetical protein